MRRNVSDNSREVNFAIMSFSGYCISLCSFINLSFKLLNYYYPSAKLFVLVVSDNYFWADMQVTVCQKSPGKHEHWFSLHLGVMQHI